MKFILPIVVGVLFSITTQAQINLNLISTYSTNVFDGGATEIVTYNNNSQRIFSTNGNTGMIDIIDISDPNFPTLISSIDLSPYGKGANSVTTHGYWVAAAVENFDKQAPGFAVFFDVDGNFITSLTIGSLPDNITTSKNGKTLMVACEGEPNDDYSIDPEGTIAIIEIPGSVHNLNQSDVTLLNFNAYDNAVLDPSIRVNMNPGNSSVSQDLEPEYCTISSNGKIGYVSLQENNAMAIVNLKRKKIRKIVGLGFKDHSIVGNGYDASNESASIDITTHPTLGMYQPDAIASYKVHGQTYIVTANEGDSRDYSGYSEEVRVKDLVLDPTAYPSAAVLQEETNLGRLKTTTATGDYDNDGDIDQIFSYGGRSFSIRDSRGNLVFDSGDMFEQLTAGLIPSGFNASNDEQDAKDRSDDKGPEPEAVELGRINGEYYAFIGLERVGGVMVFNISDPTSPYFVDYLNNRDFTQDPTTAEALDLGPEEIVFIRHNKSPNGQDMIVVSNEVSGTISFYNVNSTGNYRTASDISNDAVAAEFGVYPNPSTGSHVYFGETQSHVDVYTLLGEKVLEVENTTSLNISSLPAGVYLVRNQDGESIQLNVSGQ